MINVNLGVRIIRNVANKLIVLFFILNSLSVLSQTNDSTYLNYLLKDKSVPKRNDYAGDKKNIIKTNIISIIDGELPIIWEHRFNDRFGFDIGPGLIMPYSANKRFGAEDMETAPFFDKNIFYLNPDFENTKFSASFLVEPKVFFHLNDKFIIKKTITFLSPFFRVKAYPNQFVKEIGISYGGVREESKFSSSLSFALSYTIETPYDSDTVLKYRGTASKRISSFNLPEYTLLRFYIRINIGTVIN